MAKFIAYITGQPLTMGYKVHEFQWDQALQVYVWKGLYLTEENVNAELAIALTRRRDRLVLVKMIESTPAGVVLPDPEPAPISTITAKEVTLDDALEIVARLAPERLRKKPGPIQAPPAQATG